MQVQRSLVFVLLFSAGIFAVLLTSRTLAQAETGWRTSTVIYVHPKTERETKFNFVYPWNTTNPGAMIGCRGSKLLVLLSKGPVDFREILQDTTRRGRFVTIDLYRNGELDDSRGWDFWPEFGIYFSNERRPAARVYNMVVREDEFAFEAGGERIKIDLPPVDEAFTEFSQNCDLIKKKSLNSGS